MSATAQTSAPMASPAVDRNEIEQFLFEEARLLDDREFETCDVRWNHTKV